MFYIASTKCFLHSSTILYSSRFSTSIDSFLFSNYITWSLYHCKLRHLLIFQIHKSAFVFDCWQINYYVSHNGIVKVWNNVTIKEALSYEMLMALIILSFIYLWVNWFKAYLQLTKNTGKLQLSIVRRKYRENKYFFCLRF